MLWLVFVLGASGTFLWQVGKRTVDFYQYKTNVDVQVKKDNISIELKYDVKTFKMENTNDSYPCYLGRLMKLGSLTSIANVNNCTTN